MPLPNMDQLTKAEELFDAGNLVEALEILNDNIQIEELNSQQKDYFQLYKGLILLYQYKFDELIEFGEQLFKKGQNLNDNLQSFDGLFFLIAGLGLADRFNEALQKIETAELFLRKIPNKPKNIIFQRRARIRVLKGWINLELANIDLAEKCLGWVIDLQNKLGNTFEIVWANLLMGRVIYHGKHKFNLALEYIKKAKSLAKEIRFNHHWIALSELMLGVIHIGTGELDIGLKYHVKSLEIFKEIKNNWFIGAILTNLGVIYFSMGDYDLALKYYEESLLHLKPGKETPLSNLVEAALEMGDTKLAQKYFNQLENLYNQKKDHLIVLNYQLSKALMLKHSSRIRDKAKVEELLKKVIATETIWFDSTITALVYLCDLLFSEYRLNNNKEVLDELNHYVSKLLSIADKQHSYIVFCKTFILQAKLALINYDVKAARRFLTEAQKITEKYGIKHLAKKISFEHDELLRQIKIWENLEGTGAPMSERLKLAGLNEEIRHSVRNQMIEVPELSDEDPVLLLIVSEGGIPLFTHSFIKEKSIESQIFGSFLTTIDYFVREMFAEGLDRAIFGEYTLLMKSIPPFFISYIFKGDSYYAIQKTKKFIDHIQKEENIWQNLLKSFQVNQMIRLKDIPLLETLITDIFIKKSVIISEL